MKVNKKEISFSLYRNHELIGEKCSKRREEKSKIVKSIDPQLIGLMPKNVVSKNFR